MLLALTAGSVLAEQCASSAARLQRSAQNLTVTFQGKAAFDARRAAQHLLDDSSVCTRLDYRIQPLSKVGALFSYLEEVHLSGHDCGASGQSYDLSIQVLDLRTGTQVKLTSLLSKATLLKLLQRDSYLQAAARKSQVNLGAPTLEAVLQNFGDNYNGEHCDAALDAFALGQFYVQSATPTTVNVRLGLTSSCGVSADGVSFPKVLGLSLPAQEAKALVPKAGDLTLSDLHAAPGLSFTLKRR